MKKIIRVLPVLAVLAGFAPLAAFAAPGSFEHSYSQQTSQPQPNHGGEAEAGR